VLGNLKIDLPENTIGFESSEDCAVVPLDEDHYLLQSVDFFTPIVDDPYTFGRIAAANSLSDIYAMGGMPQHALNIAEFPSEDSNPMVFSGRSTFKLPSTWARSDGLSLQAQPAPGEN